LQDIKLRRSIFMMKKAFVFLGLPALLLAVVLSGCSGDDPKALAQRTYELNKQAAGALLNPAKAAKAVGEAAKIAKKAEGLSASDRAIYTAELARLTGQGLGGALDAMGGALGASGALLDAASGMGNALDAMSGALEASSGLLDAASGLTGGVQDTQQLLDTARGAVDAAEKASNLANSLFGSGR
jgi:hypothetical protein